MRQNIALFLCAFLGAVSGVHASDPTPWSERSQWIGWLTERPSGVLTRSELNRLAEVGEHLFRSKFTELDGAGRPESTQAIVPTRARNRAATNFVRTSGPDANSCASCHNDPVPGGAGDFVTTTFVSEGFANADFDTIDPQFSNERGSNHLFGAGLVELLAREMTRDLRAIRKESLREARRKGEPVRAALLAKGVEFGHVTAHPDGLVDLEEVEGVDSDLVVRPFSQKGVMTSLRQFTVNAMNHHHGMQAVERFGARWTGTDDHDGDGKAFELGEAEISALVAWQATRPPPGQTIPENRQWQAATERGSKQFDALGCQMCHKRALPLESLRFSDPGPLDMAGTLSLKEVETPAIYDLGLFEWAAALPRDSMGRVLVPLFGDLKRHRITDPANQALGNELLSQRFVDRNHFQTAELWGIGSTAPYGHRNDFTTLDSVIRAHGGEAANATRAYVQASEADRSALIAFLKTLVIGQ